MTDNSIDTGSDFIAADVGQAFKDHSGSVSTEPANDLTSTARAEIEIAEQTKQALISHDDRWQQISDRLSNRPTAAPTLDLGGSSHRSITQEYTAHREQWQTQKGQIEVKAMMETTMVRTNGTTLSNTFPTSASPTSEKTSPGPTNNEFVVKTPSSSQEMER